MTKAERDQYTEEQLEEREKSRLHQRNHFTMGNKLDDIGFLEEQVASFANKSNRKRNRKSRRRKKRKNGRNRKKKNRNSSSACHRGNPVSRTQSSNANKTKPKTKPASAAEPLDNATFLRLYSNKWNKIYPSLCHTKKRHQGGFRDAL